MCPISLSSISQKLPHPSMVAPRALPVSRDPVVTESQTAGGGGGKSDWGQRPGLDEEEKSKRKWVKRRVWK